MTEDVSQPDSQKLDEMRKKKEHTATMGGLMFIGALILAGFYTQIALDVISMGVEHGHAHDEDHHH